MKSLQSYILESKVDVDAVKQFLIKRDHVKTWEECIDNQKYGDCRKICTRIMKQFPDMFDKQALDINVDFSEQAKKLIHDDDDMFGNHYVLTKGDIYYDFARGANCIDGIYVLTQDNNKDKYNITLTDAEKDLITVEVRRNLFSNRI